MVHESCELAVGGPSSLEFFRSLLELALLLGELLLQRADVSLELVDVRCGSETRRTLRLLTELLGKPLLQLPHSRSKTVFRSSALARSACKEARLTAASRPS